MWKNSRAKDCSATKGQQLAESCSSEPSLLGFTALMVVLSDPCTYHSHSQPSWRTASHEYQSAASVNSLILFLHSLLFMCATSPSIICVQSLCDLIIILPDKQHSSANRKAHTLSQSIAMQWSFKLSKLTNHYLHTLLSAALLT